MSENRLAVISIIVENRERSPQINAVLSDFGNYIVGRMGIPYKEKNVAVMCVVIDAPALASKNNKEMKNAFIIN